MKDLVVLVLKCPVLDPQKAQLRTKGKKGLKEWKSKGFYAHNTRNEKKFKLRYSFVEDFSKNNVWKICHKINTPTLILAGDQDKFIVTEEVQRFTILVKSCKVELLPGADHIFSKPEDFQKMIQKISDFILSQKLK